MDSDENTKIEIQVEKWLFCGFLVWLVFKYCYGLCSLYILITVCLQIVAEANFHAPLWYQEAC